MNKKSPCCGWSQDFQNFIHCECVEPPQKISRGLLYKVTTDLNPSRWHVLTKLVLIHVVVGTITLLACPQFGVGLLPNAGLMDLWMKFGDVVCTFACGVFFVSGTAFLSALLLRTEEVKVLRKQRMFQFLGLTTFSLCVFMTMGAPVLTSLTMLWVLGALVGGLVNLELAWWLRLRNLHS